MSLDALAVELRDSYERYGPLTRGTSLVRIDTTDFATIDYTAIVEMVRRLV